MSDTPMKTGPNTGPELAARVVLIPANLIMLVMSLLTAALRFALAPFFIIYFHEALGFSTASAGLLVGLYFGSGIVFSLAGGYISDRLGLLRAYVLAGIIYGFAVGAIGLAHAYWGIATLMVVAGVMTSVTSSALQGIANARARPEHRGLIQNYLYWMNNVGIVLGLLVSALILGAGHSALPFLTVGGVQILLGVIAPFALRTPHREATPPEEETAQPGLRQILRLVGTDRALLYAAGAMVLLVLIESQLDATVPLELNARFQDGARLLGPLLAINSVVVVAGQPLAMRFLAERNPLAVFSVGSIVQAFGLATGGIIGSVAGWAIGITLYSVGEVLWSYTFNNLIAQLPTPGREATYFSLFGGTQRLGMFLGITFGPILYGAVSPQVLFGAVIIPALLAAWCFRMGTQAFRRRTLREMAGAEVVAEVRLAKEKEPAPAAAAPREETAPPLERAPLEGAAAFLPPRDPGGEAAFLLPSRPDKLPFLQGLDEAGWEALLGYTEPVYFEPEEILLVAGEADRSMYIVTDGQLEVVVHGQNDAYTRLTLIEARSIFGEQSFVDGRPRSATIRAVTPGEIRRFEWSAFLALSQARPELAQTFMADLARILSERLRRTTEYLNRMHAA